MQNTECLLTYALTLVD